jgi:hypothetical protein
MSFMIEEEDADEAVRSLHAAFFKDPDPAIFDVEARKPLPVNSEQLTATIPSSLFPLTTDH